MSSFLFFNLQKYVKNLIKINSLFNMYLCVRQYITMNNQGKLKIINKFS